MELLPLLTHPRAPFFAFICSINIYRGALWLNARHGAGTYNERLNEGLQLENSDSHLSDTTNPSWVLRQVPGPWCPAGSSGHGDDSAWPASSLVAGRAPWETGCEGIL